MKNSNHKFYRGFEEIDVLYLVPVFHWLCKFGLDVLLGIERKLISFYFLILPQNIL